jgi:hypothetical protein
MLLGIAGKEPKRGRTQTAVSGEAALQRLRCPTLGEEE